MNAVQKAFYNGEDHENCYIFAPSIRSTSPYNVLLKTRGKRYETEILHSGIVLQTFSRG